jgi:uncharacterized OsmC-like protein
MKNESIVLQRQRQLNATYENDPSQALITDSSEVIGINLHDPFRTTVSISDEFKVPFKIGIHRAVGGDHDHPNSGDLLCATLAVCFESTIRMISNRLNIELSETRVKASAQVDVRGTLMIDKSVPVGFQSMQLDVVIVSKTTDQRMMNMLLKAVEQSCIIYQTLKQGMPVTITSNLE